MKINNRLCKIPEYHFKRIENIKNEMMKQGRECVELGIGDPDLPVHENIKNALIKSLDHKEFNKYPPYEGIKELRNEIIKYYKSVYDVSLDDEEVLVLIGSKEGISNIIPAICDIGDKIIIPNPGYPPYEACSYLWGVEPYKVPIVEQNNYYPKLSTIPNNIVKNSKLFMINYPNNPTGARATIDFYKEIICFCSENNIILCNDGAYNEIIPKDQAPLSLLQADKEKKCVEFGTFSKIYNMTGFRIGYVVGNKEIIKHISKVKSNVDSGQFYGIQIAAVEALKLSRDYVNSVRSIYDERRKTVKKILTEKNIKYFNGDGALYIWCNVPKNYTVDEFCLEILQNYGLIVTPGYTFGNLGYNYFRISLTENNDIIDSSLRKLKLYDK